MANRWTKFTTGRGTFGFVAQAVRICALAACASVAAASCTVAQTPYNSIATFEIEVVNPDGTVQWRKMYRTVTEHYPRPNCGGNEEEGDEQETDSR